MNNSDQPGGSRCRLLALTALIGLGMATAGCEEPKEKVLDVDAPGVDIEVHKEADDGTEVEIGVDAEEADATE